MQKRKVSTMDEEYQVSRTKGCRQWKATDSTGENNITYIIGHATSDRKVLGR